MQAKVGNYPFTTIEPNTGVTYYRAPCPCVAHDKKAECCPKYGRCEDGVRFIPVRLLDVAGLVPGASEGKGLGNKFLNDLREADVLLHILDASGTTNEKGEATVGYDPINDAEWLHGEVHAWIYNNLWGRWGSVARKHTATKSSVANTLQLQLSGYGANGSTVNRTLDEMGVRDPVDLSDWGEDQVHSLVDAFLKVRFPTLLLLNKADQGGETDRNIARIVERYDASRCFVSSAAAECFLKICKQKGQIRYTVGDRNFETLYDIQDDLDFRKMRGEDVSELETAIGSLVALDGKTKKRLEKIRDMVMFRYGGTGVWGAVQAAVETQKPVVVYPVRSLTNFSTEAEGRGVFGSAMILRAGSTVRTAVGHTCHGMLELFQYGELLEEGDTRRRVGEDFVLPGGPNIIKFFFKAAEDQPPAPPPQRQKPQTKVEKKKEGDAAAAAGGGGA